MSDLNPISQEESQAITNINRDLKEKAVAERAKETGMAYVNLSAFPINPDVLHLVREENAKLAMVMPFYKSGKQVRLAINDPMRAETVQVIDALRKQSYDLMLYLASDVSILEAQKLYASQRYKPVEAKTVEVGTKKLYEEELKNLAKFKDKLETLPAEEALEHLHGGAIKAGASDIHYEPEEKFCTVRFRIDGVLHNVFDISKSAHTNIVNQLKFKSQMKLNITNVPQDGRFSFDVEDRKIDVRVSLLPTQYGESIVCRILDSGKEFLNFDQLGFMWKSLEILKKTVAISNGVVLCTGPTGSGKTTTLYSLIHEMNSPERKIITLEDPIEYNLKGITQSQINEKRGYTFADGLRSVLRQDPNIVMIGEIRDLKTADAAAQAALTGHVLLSTLHTNSAVETIPRLLSIGMKPFIIAPSLHTIIAQRLVRRVCGQCGVDRDAKAEEQKLFEENMEVVKQVHPDTNLQVRLKIKEAKGCEACNLTGFRGQMVLSEVFMVDSDVKKAILDGAPTEEILKLARKQGMLTLREDGILKAMLGHTTLDEVFRVTAIV
jgi:type IV pilus assembly protein PilB